MVVAQPTEDNAERISVFKTTRLVLRACAVRSPIVSNIPFQPPSRAYGDGLGPWVIFTTFDAFHLLKVTRPNLASGMKVRPIFWLTEWTAETALDVGLTWSAANKKQSTSLDCPKSFCMRFP
jgi:hypothetical protein